MSRLMTTAAHVSGVKQSEDFAASWSVCGRLLSGSRGGDLASAYGSRISSPVSRRAASSESTPLWFLILQGAAVNPNLGRDL